MSTPFIGEIRMFGFAFAPKGWAQCNGQLLPIAQNQALFAILGTTFGGNGVQTFGLPDLRGRVPMHWGTGTFGPVALGQSMGEEAHTLIANEVPTHAHVPAGSSDTASSSGPVNNVLASSTQSPYAPALTNAVTLNSATVSTAGGSQPHENRQPFTVVSACIALLGVFPSRN
ncbi:MAG: phage tail protein [Proteobacteria bacterium]|nr:phage tail protein [Pseudomonadota bacterium]